MEAENLEKTGRHYGKNFCSAHFMVDIVLHLVVYRIQ